MSAFSALKRSRQRFVDAFVATGIATEAARESGYGKRRPDVAAGKLMALPDVKAAIAERTEQAISKAGVRSVRVLEELCKIAYFNPKQLLDEKGEFRPLHLIEDDVAAALTSLEVEELGAGKTRVRKYRASQKIEALKILCQYLRLLVQQHEVAGPGGGPIPVAQMTDLEIARRIAFLMDAGLRSAPYVLPAAPAASTPLSAPKVSDDRL